MGELGLFRLEEVLEDVEEHEDDDEEVGDHAEGHGGFPYSLILPGGEAREELERLICLQVPQVGVGEVRPEESVVEDVCEELVSAWGVGPEDGLREVQGEDQAEAVVVVGVAVQSGSDGLVPHGEGHNAPIPNCLHTFIGEVLDGVVEDESGEALVGDVGDVEGEGAELIDGLSLEDRQDLHLEEVAVVHEVGVPLLQNHLEAVIERSGVLPVWIDIHPSALIVVLHIGEVLGRKRQPLAVEVEVHLRVVFPV
mmetsp:Transcript_30229/g.29534  ORF Transcript_30229/g.29534 Transcript_30229/m.29534 type:complete len:253 (-) Transcript_30229:1784-2542(-)